MTEQTEFWSSSLQETYVNLCHVLTNESGDSIWIVSFFVLVWGSLSKGSILLTRIGWVTRVSCCTEHSCQCLYLWWQCLTIIFMVNGTMLILHSSITSYNVHSLLYLIFVILLSSLSHINHVYSCLYYPCVAYELTGGTCLFCRESDHVWFLPVGTW